MAAAYTAWGTVGNAAYAFPMVRLTPVDPVNQGYVLAWNIVEQGLDYMPLYFNPVTGDATNAGHFGVEVNKVFKVDGVQVVSARQVGWTAMTGTDDFGARDTATITLAQLAGRFKALQDDLMAHGLIGV